MYIFIMYVYIHLRPKCIYTFMSQNSETSHGLNVYLIMIKYYNINQV